jgi:hypothetical protein
VSPREVFDLLSDPRSFGHWVVGSREIRAADDTWPAPGARFEHTVGNRWLRIKDHTTVVASRPPVMLELFARARPLPDARIAIGLEPEGRGTRVTMIENPANRVLSVLAGPLGHGLIRLRNAKSLERLKALAETRPAAAGRSGAAARRDSSRAHCG